MNEGRQRGSEWKGKELNERIEEYGRNSKGMEISTVFLAVVQLSKGDVWLKDIEVVSEEGSEGSVDDC